MAELYSVHIKRKVLVYSGAKLEHVEERLVDEVYHDLPMKTCQAYRDKFGDQVVAIRPSPRSVPRNTRPSRERAETKPERSKARSPRSSRFASAGYAEAINEHLRRGA